MGECWSVGNDNVGETVVVFYLYIGNPGGGMKILLVEDEQRIAGFIKRGLREERYVVDVAGTGEQGLFFLSVNAYDLIILDIMLPDMDGVQLCKDLRRKKITTPVLMLTAKCDISDKISGLDAGADDYLTKPFAFEEFLARIRALLRRATDVKTTTLRIADLELDQVSRKITRAGKPIVLTGKEYSLLEYFMVHANQVITRTMISEHVWAEDFDRFSNVIDVYVNYLRNKIDKGFPRKLIHSIRGTGYVLKEK